VNQHCAVGYETDSKRFDPFYILESACGIASALPLCRPLPTDDTPSCIYEPSIADVHDPQVIPSTAIVVCAMRSTSTSGISSPSLASLVAIMTFGGVDATVALIECVECSFRHRC